MLALMIASVAAVVVDYNSVRPILECVDDNGDDTYTAHFGYLNQNDFLVQIPLGENNFLTGNAMSGSPVTEFAPGRTPYYNDVGYAAFDVVFDGNNLVWTLEGPDGSRRTATASANSAACTYEPPQDVPEFGLLAALGVVAVAGFFVFRRRN